MLSDFNAASVQITVPAKPVIKIIISGGRGPQGFPGADSTVPGPPGDPGEPGAPGLPGTPGVDGVDGISPTMRLVAETVFGTAYTVQIADEYAAKRLINAALVTVTAPLDATLAVPIGSRCRFCAEGAAGAVVAAEAGVTILSRDNALIAAQYAIFELHKVDTDTWWLLGDVS